MTATRPDRVLAARAFITDRDVCLLEWLHDHEALTIDQITSALYDARRTATDRLLRLHRLGILDRFQHTVSGQRTVYYVLGPLGAEIVAALRGVLAPRTSDVVARQRRIAMSPTLAHFRGASTSSSST